MKGLVLFAHGARDPNWATPFLRLQKILANQHKDTVVVLAFLEMMSPKLVEAVAGMVELGINTIHVVPLFLGPGAHFRQDFSGIMDDLRAVYPLLQLVELPVLGESETILLAISNWISVALAHPPS